ncbi:hypothetical protein ACLKA6_007041 [Drosophila palustris]
MGSGATDSHGLEWAWAYVGRGRTGQRSIPTPVQCIRTFAPLPSASQAKIFVPVLHLGLAADEFSTN